MVVEEVVVTIAAIAVVVASVVSSCRSCILQV